MRIYVKALKNSRTDVPKPFLLIIEEINRANVAAVFGDVFQLLDRGDDEVSEYPIQASEDIKKYLAQPENLGGSPDDYSEIRIPDNMFIWATMNSADQGVFPMDTAFKRRWDFTYLGIDDSEAGIVGKKVELGEGEYRRVVEWNVLRKAINSELLTYKVNEQYRNMRHKKLIDLIDKPQWSGTTPNGELFVKQAEDTLIPDLISIVNADGAYQFLIFDAKYYNIQLDHNKKLRGQPGIESITKQYLYQLVYQPFVEAHQIGIVRNCFLMPTASAEIKKKGIVSLNMLRNLGLMKYGFFTRLTAILLDFLRTVFAVFSVPACFVNDDIAPAFAFGLHLCELFTGNDLRM